MPQILGAIIGAVVSIASVVGSVIGAITGVLSAVLSPIIGALSSVIGAILGPVTSVISRIMGPLTRITSVITKKLFGDMSIMTSKLIKPFKSIAKLLTGGISDLTGALTGKAAMILRPLRDALLPIRAMVTSAQTAIFEGLGPVAELSDFVRTISTIKISRLLLEGTETMGLAMNRIVEHPKLRVPAAILTLWTETVKATTAIMTVVDDHFVVLRDAIDGVDEKLTQERETALALMEERIDTTTTLLAEGFSLRMEPMETQIASVAIRLEDLPRFQRMMSKALA